MDNHDDLDDILGDAVVADGFLPVPAPDGAGNGSAESVAEWLTSDEASALLRVDRKSLQAAALQGEVPGAARIGRIWRFHRPALLGPWPNRRKPQPALRRRSA